MDPTLTTTALLLLLALVVALLVAAARRSRRREAKLEAALERALAGLAPRLQIEGEEIVIADGGRRLSRRRLLDLLRRGTDAEALAAAVAEVARRPLAPLAGPFSLKAHGSRVTLHLVDPLVLAVGDAEPRLARTPVDDLGLTATYRIDGRADQSVTEEHLRELAIDTRDLHRIALAVLRQSLDLEQVRRALAGERQTLEAANGRAAAALLVLADFIPAGGRLVARLPTPDRLVLGPSSEASEPQGGAPDGRLLAVDDEGYRIL